MKAIFLCDNPQNVERVYSDETKSRISATVGGLDEHIYSHAELIAAKGSFDEVEYIFSTWGMPALTEDEIADCLPDLKAVFYAAGTVQAFARPFIRRNIAVFSAWAANAVPVAEYTLSQILLANKGYFAMSGMLSQGGDYAAAQALRSRYPGNYGAAIGLIGAGMIGSMVANMLKAHKFSVKVFDPFLSDEKAEELGVVKCSLEELFESCNVVSNHLANNEQTRGMLTYRHFASMPQYATFINTGRGAQVVEDDLVRALRERDDLVALLDVTYPEPPTKDHAFFSLKNCFLTPHIAGSIGDEVRRMYEYMADECARFVAGEPTRWQVSERMLETMA